MTSVIPPELGPAEPLNPSSKDAIPFSKSLSQTNFGAPYFSDREGTIVGLRVRVLVGVNVGIGGALAVGRIVGVSVRTGVAVTIRGTDVGVTTGVSVGVSVGAGVAVRIHGVAVRKTACCCGVGVHAVDKAKRQMKERMQRFILSPLIFCRDVLPNGAAAQLLSMRNQFRIIRHSAIPLSMPLSGIMQKPRRIILQEGILCGNVAAVECGIRRA